MERNKELPASPPTPPPSTPLLSLSISLPVSLCPSLLIFPLPSSPSSQPFPPPPHPPCVSFLIVYSHRCPTCLPTSLPLLPYLSSVLRCCYCVIHGGGFSSPFAPVPAHPCPGLLDRKGEEEVSLDSTDEAERLVDWGCKFSLMDLQ